MHGATIKIKNCLKKVSAALIHLVTWIIILYTREHLVGPNRMQCLAFSFSVNYWIVREAG